MSSVLPASRSCFVASERGEAGEDGTRAGNTAAGVAATGAAASGAGGGTQPAAAQQRWVCCFFFSFLTDEKINNRFVSV